MFLTVRWIWQRVTRRPARLDEGAVANKRRLPATPQTPDLTGFGGIEEICKPGPPAWRAGRTSTGSRHRYLYKGRPDWLLATSQRPMHSPLAMLLIGAVAFVGAPTDALRPSIPHQCARG